MGHALVVGHGLPLLIFRCSLCANDAGQAQDRAHRIGQTREVRVLRLVCANTMEEDILERSTYKKELGGAAIDGGMFNEKSTVEDRHDFLRKIFSRSCVPRP